MVVPQCMNSLIFFFFFNHTATTEIYTLSLHDALPIFNRSVATVKADAAHKSFSAFGRDIVWAVMDSGIDAAQDRKSTRLNSSHGYISYAVFCLKKKKITTNSKPPTNTNTVRA